MVAVASLNVHLKSLSAKGIKWKCNKVIYNGRSVGRSTPEAKNKSESHNLTFTHLLVSSRLEIALICAIHSTVYEKLLWG